MASRLIYVDCGTALSKGSFETKCESQGPKIGTIFWARNGDLIKLSYRDFNKVVFLKGPFSGLCFRVRWACLPPRVRGHDSRVENDYCARVLYGMFQTFFHGLVSSYSEVRQSCFSTLHMLPCAGHDITECVHAVAYVCASARVCTHACKLACTSMSPCIHAIVHLRVSRFREPVLHRGARGSHPSSHEKNLRWNTQVNAIVFFDFASFPFIQTRSPCLPSGLRVNTSAGDVVFIRRVSVGGASNVEFG